MARSLKVLSEQVENATKDGERTPTAKRRTAPKDIGERRSGIHITIGESVIRRCQLAAIKRGMTLNLFIHHTLDINAPLLEITEVKQ